MTEILDRKLDISPTTYLLVRKPNSRHHSLKIHRMRKIIKSSEAKIISITISPTEIFKSALNHPVCLPEGIKIEVLVYQITKKGNEIPIEIFDLDELETMKNADFPCDYEDRLAVGLICDSEYTDQLFKCEVNQNTPEKIALKISCSVGKILMTQ